MLESLTDGPIRGINKAIRADDKRKSQGQTVSNFRNEVTGAPMEKSEIGDTFEQLFMAKGKSILEKRYGKMELMTGAGTGTSRTTPLDLISSQWGVELKSISTRTKSQKSAMTADQIHRKMQAVAENDLNPLVVVQVVDQDNRRAKVYAHEAFKPKAVSKMEYLGEYEYLPSDFQAAQQLSGHDTQQINRALKRMSPEQREIYADAVDRGLSAEEAVKLVWSLVETGVEG